MNSRKRPWLSLPHFLVLFRWAKPITITEMPAASAQDLALWIWPQHILKLNIAAGFNKGKSLGQGEKTRSSTDKCFWLPQYYTDTTESQAIPLGSRTMLPQSPKNTYNTTSHGFFLFLGNKGLLEDDSVWTSLEASCFFLLFQFFFQLLERKPVR